MNLVLLLVAVAIPLLLIYPITSMSQTATEDGAGVGEVPGGLIPENNAIGPVGNTGAEYKFDHGFYQKIQGLIRDVPRNGDPGVYDGKRYYNVIVVVTRDDGDGRDPDVTAKENKDAVVKRLGLIGARNVTAAESLSFVTASIPVADVPGFSLHEEVYRLGDGELPMVPATDKALQAIHATPAEILAAAGTNLNGSGVVVGVIDTGIYHDTAFDGRILGHAVCIDSGCRGTVSPSSTDPITHGTRVAQVLAASGLPMHNGTAPGVELIDIRSFLTLSAVTHGLDYALRYGADIVSLSIGIDGTTEHDFCQEYPTKTTTANLIINEAVDKGMIVAQAAGNHGWDDDSAVYESIDVLGCGSNVITVGGINASNSQETTMFVNASRGPAGGTLILKPEIAAPAYNIEILDFNDRTTTSPRSGTSYAAPQVSATAALLLQAKPDMTPVEVKAAILLGADWQGPVPCTSSQYEQNRPSDDCSHAKKPSDVNTANNAASLSILNNVGFGILDVSQTLKYASTRTVTHNHVMGDYLDTQTSSKQYSFSVTDTSDPVKVILTWFAHPHGSITEQLDRVDPPSRTVKKFPVNIADLGFTVSAPNGTVIQRAQSAHQTNEFVVFDPPQTGTYTITVSGSGLSEINKPVQNFALASTHSLSPLPAPFLNAPPSAQPMTVIINPNQEDPAIVLLRGADQNGDPLSFSVSDDPDHGTVSTDEFIANTVSRVLYSNNPTFSRSDTFAVTPYDGLATGTPATITIAAESLPTGYTNGALDKSKVRDWESLEVTTGFAHTTYVKTFSGKSYPVSALYVSSVNMEGVDLSFTTTSGRTYTAAVPPSGDRMIEFQSPVTIRSATLSADGIDEEAAQDMAQFRENQRLTRYTTAFGEVSMSVGYVPSSCSSGSSGSSGATGSSSATCPAHATYTATTNLNLGIPDNTDRQDTSSIIGVPVHGTITSISATVGITHTDIGDLKVVLTPPSGSQAVLHSRTGGGTDNISTTYSSSANTGLRSLHGIQINGNWTLSVGDYAGGDVGTLNNWTIAITYAPSFPSPPPSPTQPSSTTTVFTDDFESSSFTTKWTESGEGDWRLSTSSAHSVPTAPGHASTNKVMHVDDCDTTCTITLKSPLDLSDYDSATLSFLRFVDYGLDSGEYLKVELYDGTSWNQVYRWTHGSGDDNRWHDESYDLSSYLVSGFKVRFVAHMSVPNEDVQLDDIVINATSSGSGSPTPAPSDYSVYVADTDDREVLVFSRNGTYLDGFVDRRAGGLGKAWDLAFGPDGHLYVSDNTYYKIRKYNGATGAPIGSSSTGWASTVGFPHGLTWEGNALYVATSRGVEKFSSSGSSLGYFGDAHRSPTTAGATALVSPQDVVFCSDSRMYVSDKSLGKILYYRASDGTYLGAISGTASSTPNTRAATGLECGSAMIGSGTSLYQSGDDDGRINEINPSTGSQVRSITTLIDEPYCMDMDAAGVLYVANKDDNNIVKITSAQSSVFASGNSMDDPRGVTVGSVYSTGASGRGSSQQSDSAQDVQNDEPEFVLMYNGTATYGPIILAAQTTLLTVQATDPEGDAITIGIISDHLLPDGAMSVTDHRNGTATVTVSSVNATAGTYALWVEVSDAEGNHDREPYAVIVS